jgi:tetratricopeptide (TPR) repeat protein
MKNKILIFALLFCPIVPSFAVAAPHPDDVARLNACITKSRTSAAEAYEDGLQWRLRGGSLLAEQCIALAQIEQGEYSQGAQRLLAIANASDGGAQDEKLGLLVKSANAFLLAEMPEDAKAALDFALSIAPDNSDVLFDRARTNAMLSQWSEAEADLTRAMATKAPLSLAFRLRAEARMQQGKYDLAENDVSEALRLDPSDADNYHVRGRVRVARRTGHAPE